MTGAIITIVTYDKLKLYISMSMSSILVIYYIKGGFIRGAINRHRYNCF